MEERAPASFGKSLYFGHIPEPLVVPYPQLRQEERDSLALVLDQFKKFAQAEVDSRKIDEEARLPPAVLDGMRRLGLFGLAIPEAYGGLGFSVTAYARAVQEIGGVDGSIAVTLAGHQSIGCKGLVLYGNDEQKERYLPRLASGEMIAAFGLTEPGAGSDAASIKMRARPEPDGSFVLDGSKIWITNGGIADFFTVFAQTEVERDGGKKDRITAFLVERGFGVKSGPEEHKLGIKGSSTTALYFDGVRVPRQNVLGTVGGGFKVAMGVLNNGRLGLLAPPVRPLHLRVRPHQGQDRAHDDGDLRRRVDGLSDDRPHRSRHRGLLGRVGVLQGLRLGDAVARGQRVAADRRRHGLHEGVPLRAHFTRRENQFDFRRNE
jgi:acyl-CoA dehydrogenase family protein 9